MGIRKCVPADALTSCRISWKRHVGVGERTEEEEGKKNERKRQTTTRRLEEQKNDVYTKGMHVVPCRACI